MFKVQNFKISKFLIDSDLIESTVESFISLMADHRPSNWFSNRAAPYFVYANFHSVFTSTLKRVTSFDNISNPLEIS